MTTRIPYSMTDAPLNVLRFGAKADGVTDDTTAIQAALTAAAGKQLHFPAGTYRVTSGLTVGVRTRITGEGPLNSVIDYRTTSTSTNRLFLFNNTDNIHVEDLGLNCNIAGGGRATTAIAAVGSTGPVTELYLRRVYITGFQQYGVLLDDDAYYVVLEQCRIYGCSNATANGGSGTGNAVGLYFGKPVNAVRLRDCRISANDKAIDCSDSTGKYSLNVTGCYFEGNGLTGSPAEDDTITLNAWNAVVFQGNYLENNLTGTATADSALRLRGVGGALVQGNLFAGAYGGVSKSKNLIGVSDTCRGVVIEGNEFQDPITKMVYVLDGASIASLRRNRYIVSNSALTTYAAIMAKMTAALVELDVGHIAAVNTGTIAAGGNYQVNLTVDGIPNDRNISVVCTPQVGGADWVFCAAPITTDTVRFMAYNIKGANNSFVGNVVIRVLKDG